MEAQHVLTPEVLEARHCAKSPRWLSPHRSLAGLLAARASAHPERVFLSFLDNDAGIERRWTYGALAEEVGRTCAWLRREGLGPGRRAAFLTGNLDHAIVLYLSVWAMGACVVPLSASETEERKHFILRHSGSRLLFARPEYFEEAQRLAARLAVRLVFVRRDDRDAPPPEVPVYPPPQPSLEAEALDAAELDAEECEALLVYTSGTTGAPKGVLLDQFNVMADADAIATWHRWDATTRALCVLPIHHVNGIIVSHVTPLWVGGSTVLTPGFSSRTFWSQAARERITTVSLVPTLLQFLLEAAGDTDASTPHALRSVLCGAGPLRADTALAFEAKFRVPLIHGYGLSETTGYNCQLPVDLSADERRSWLSDHGFPSIGCALPHHEMTIVRLDGSIADPGERGEICVRGDVVSRGYFGRPDANREVFRGGWFHTGDEGFFLLDAHARAFFFITGRLKELIIRGGVNYSPLEIDEALSAHPDVEFALAIPFENRYYGEEIAAYVVPARGARLSEAELLEWCTTRLDFARSPKVVLFGSDVPYTSTGKPKRIELARRLAASLAPYHDVQFRRDGSPPP